MDYIQDALIEALEHKNLDKITVKEICDKANISRQTLYYHYGSLGDVFISWYDETITERLVEKDTYLNWVEGFREILQTCTDHRNVITNVYKSSLKEDFIRAIDAVGRRYVSRAVDDVSNNLGIPILQVDKEFMVDFYMHVFLGFTIEHIAQGMVQDPEYITSRCALMMNSSITLREQVFFESYTKKK